MLIGYMRVSKSDGSQTVDLQRDALIAAGVDPAQIYEDRASGRLDARPGLDAELISERTRAGLASARARGRKGGAPFKMTVAKVRLAMAAMGKPKTKTKVVDLCRELGVTRQTLYRHVSPAGNLREDGRKLLKTKRRELTPD